MGEQSEAQGPAGAEEGGGGKGRTRRSKRGRKLKEQTYGSVKGEKREPPGVKEGRVSKKKGGRAKKEKSGGALSRERRKEGRDQSKAKPRGGWAPPN